MIPFLSLLSNPITKLVADKVIGGAKHALEKKAMIREAEVEAIKQTDFAKIKKEEAIAKAQQAVMKEQVKASQKSWKDEYLTVVFTCILVAHFVPHTQVHMTRGWELLGNAPTEFWYIILTIVAGSFGVSTLTKWKK